MLRLGFAMPFPRQSSQGGVRRLWAAGSLALLAICAGGGPALAGDSVHGKVTAVSSAEVVTLDYGRGSYRVRIIGIDAPEEGTLAREARQFVANLVLGKNARMRLDHRTQNGEMLSRLFTDDPTAGVQDVAIALVRAGLARREGDYVSYKYGELAAAEAEAQKAKRGLWAEAPIR